jgi:hypothetical protein
MSALRKVRRSQLRSNAFISSALNNLSHGVVMTDAQKRDRVLQRPLSRNLRLAPSDIPKDMTGPELLELRRKRGVLDVSIEDSTGAGSPEGLITELPDGRSVLVNICGCRTAVRWRRTRIAASSASCRGSWHPPSNSWNRCSTMCRYASPPRVSRTAVIIFANRAFERFSRFPRDNIIGKRADEIFQPGTAASIVAGGPGGAQLARRPVPQRVRGRTRLEEARALQHPRGRARRREPAGIPDRAVRRRHRPPVAVAGTREHQEIPRTGGRQHPGIADRRARQRRPAICSPTAAPRPSSTGAARTPPA